MDKAQIRAELTRTGEISRFSHTHNWENAFKAWEAAFPHEQKPCRHCSGSYRKVKAWLEQN